jgi:hypothetical protein
MTTQQQPPQMLSLDEIASKTFGEKQEEAIVPGTPQDIVQPNIVTPTIEELAGGQQTNTQPPADEPKTVTKYSEKIKGLIEDGFLEDVSITIDDTEVYLSEMDIQDKETYQTILENIKAEKAKSKEQDYISKEGLDETTQKLIEIRKAGGDITEILRENVQAIDQLTELKGILNGYEVEDTEKEQVAINIVAQDLYNRGLSQKVVQAQIEDFIESGVIESEAAAIIDGHLALHNDAIEQRKNYELQRLEQERESYKNFKKTIASTYKSFGIPDNIQKVLIENATKQDELKITNTDKLYFEAQQKDPDLYAKVNFLLNNPQEFEKWISGKKSTEAKKEIIRSSIVINTNKKKEYKQSNNSTLEDIAANTFNK